MEAVLLCGLLNKGTWRAAVEADLRAVSDSGCSGLRKHDLLAGQLGATRREARRSGEQDPTPLEGPEVRKAGSRAGAKAGSAASSLPVLVSFYCRRQSLHLTDKRKLDKGEAVLCRKCTCPNKSLTGASDREGPGAQADLPQSPGSESGNGHAPLRPVLHLYQNKPRFSHSHAPGLEAGVVQWGRLTAVQNTFLAPPLRRHVQSLRVT